MISYAQHHEDVILNLVFQGKKTGFYIDVGAWHPIRFSVTKHFYDIGWCGINIDPAFSDFDRFISERKNDINLRIALGNKEGTCSFYIILNDKNKNCGLSTFDSNLIKDYETRGYKILAKQIELTTLNSICKKYVGKKEIDFLKIDVEGWERQVIEGGNWNKFRPRIILVEATQPCKTDILTHEKWEHLLLDANYRFLYFDGLNRFYGRIEDKDIDEYFKNPPNP